jgi:hypothetical protein
MVQARVKAIALCDFMGEISSRPNLAANSIREPRIENGTCQQESAAQRAVQVKPFEGGNVRHSNSIEIWLFASPSPTQGHPAPENLVPCEMMPRSSAELIHRAAYSHLNVFSTLEFDKEESRD